MKLKVLKSLAMFGLIAVRVISVLLPIWLLSNLLNSLYSPPYAFHAAIIGIPAVILIERVYTTFWNKRWGSRSVTGSTESKL
jgi:hypothetical protein